MIASKPNPQLRFYSQPKPSSRQKTWSTIQNMLKKEVSFKNQYPDYLAQHRKFLISDYQKKVEEIKHLKERYSASQRTSRIVNRQTRVQTERPLYSRSSPKKRVLKSAEPVRIKTDLGHLMSTINVCSFLSKIPLKPAEEVKQSIPLSPFQKNVLKRLKTRQNLIIKKKIDSFHYDSKYLMAIPLNFRLDREQEMLRSDLHADSFC